MMVVCGLIPCLTLAQSSILGREFLCSEQHTGTGVVVLYAALKAGDLAGGFSV